MYDDDNDGGVQQFQQGEHMKWSEGSTKEYQQPPVGTTVGRCVRLVDIGSQRSEFANEVHIRRQVIIGWELPNALMTEGESAGKPFVVSKFFTASLHEKSNLRKMLANWRGRDFTETELLGFDSQQILGKLCLLSLTENDKGKVRVTGIMALPKGMEVGPQVNPTVYFSLDEFEPLVYESLTDGIKKMIAASPEYAELTKPKPKQGGGNGGTTSGAFEDIDDDIPF